MSLTQAKKKCTRRKNDLIRWLDPVPALLLDQSVGKLRLEQTREGCKVAWEEFKAAYEELADAQSEDETQAVDAEEREQEFGNLDLRYHEIVVSLAEAVASREKDQLQLETRAEVERVQQEKQVETDRLQRKKTDQLALRCLQVANLYSEAKNNSWRS